MESTTLGHMLRRTVDRDPSKTALIVDDLEFTYAQVLQRSSEFARSFAGLGVSRGDHVGLLLPNSPDFVFSFFGLQLLGAVAVPINTRFRKRELGHVARNADLTLLVTTDMIVEHVDFVERVTETLPELEQQHDPHHLELTAAPRLQSVVLFGDRTVPGMLTRDDFSAAAARATTDAHEVTPTDAGDTAMMLYTSGTTAHPKGCLLTHDGVLHVWASVADRLRIGREDRIWDALPLFHMSCLGPLLFTFNLGATLITSVHFEPSTALDAIESQRATWLYSVFPPIVMGLIKDPSFADRDLSSVRALLNVAPPDTMEVIQDAFDPAVHVGGHFGMTEASGAITCNEWDAPSDRRLHTTGEVLPDTDLRVTDDEGRSLPAGEKGELRIRGRGLFAGYYGDPEATASSFEDGWFCTGDLGVVDEHGSVTYLGRIKDMIKVGGENLAPSEVESHLSTHPDLKLVQVVGVPDERLGEVPVAFVELVEGATLTEEEVIDFCVGAIASFKVPRHVVFVTEWPMSATKIQKFRLQEMFASMQTQTSS